MKCPKCKSTKTKVVHTSKYGTFIHRLRRCEKEHRFFTVERPGDMVEVPNEAQPSEGTVKNDSV